MQTMNGLDRTGLWGLMADTAGILALVFFFKSQLDDSVNSLNLPEEYNFYFVSFWAFVAAVLGGFLWNYILLRVFDEEFVLGGTNNEPKGIWAFFWGIITLLPTVTILMLGNEYYSHSGSSGKQILIYLAFIVGLSIGGFVFYSFPMGNGIVGIRNFYESRMDSFFRREFILVIIWTVLLSSGFLFAMITKALLFHFEPSIVYTFFKQTGFTVLFTTLAVVFFLTVFPTTERFDTARGIIAGLFLRISLFWGLLLTSGFS